MRTFDEIRLDIRQARQTNNADDLLRLAAELKAHETPSAEAVALMASGSAARIRGDYSQALEQYGQALALHEQLGEHDGVASVCVNIGAVYWSTGDYPAALEYSRRSFALYEELGDLAGAAIAVINIGLVYWSTGDYPTTLEYYQRALALHLERQDQRGVAIVTGNMGNVYQSTGDYSAALEHYNRALTLHHELGDKLGVALITGSIGSVYGTMGNFAEALEYFQRGLVSHQELGSRSGVAMATGNIVSALVKLHRNDEALLLLDRQDLTDIADPRSLAVYYENRAALSENAGDLETAREHLLQALAVVAGAGVRANASDYHLRLRDLALKRNDLAGYVEHNNEYTRITEEVNGKATAQRLAMMEAEKRIEAERAETEKHRALLYNTLPPAIADRVLNGEQVNDAVERAAVMFMDMVGFTSMSAAMDPNDVVRTLNEIFTACDAIMADHDLMKIKTIGDSYMAVSFSNTEDQTPNTRHVVSTANAACAMLQLMSERFPQIKVRIGIHCGPVTAGVIGTERLQYDVWGDTVNVASRMESSGEAGRIQVSEAFVSSLRLNDSLTPDSLTLLERGEISIKGKGPMTTYWLEAR